ncbi:putative dehydrogenase [Actinacidiphila reveromycinica]|uniref:Putative dehydrogenase n=1 Tax=Actinacidiphila reveromycinica TaxID=659352 RepID=A0A7U3UWX7_9ACTN|nr:SDR family oxidoreductase [Streptomyces sp. SN-593]BBB00329.1 putative dehydrogenase [Streptomyces sp. SN-593]
MDLGIEGRKALVCASSQGIGLACATALAAEGVEVWLNGRHEDTLAKAVDEVRAHATSPVHGVVGDLTTTGGRGALLEACPEPDILVTNNRGPRPGRLGELAEADLAEALDLHFSAPIHLLRAVVDGMAARRFGRIVNVTSAVVTRPSPTMVASSGARAGLTAVMKAVSKEVARHNVTINNILPERIDSGRQLQLANRTAEREGISFEEARRRQASSVAAGRLGAPAEIAAACAFLCSVPAGYISGNNLHVDGGSYLGLI